MEWVWLIVFAAGLALAGRAYLRSDGAGELPPKRPLLLVPVCSPGDRTSPALLEWAAGCLAEELGAKVTLAERPVYLQKDAFHPHTRQGDAVHIVNLVEPLVTPDRAVLGVTEYDLHSPMRRDLPFAMGARKGWAGLLSTYRMEDRANPDNTRVRLRKMLVRYGAELMCDAPRNEDPTSLLFNGLQSPEQLDEMGL